MIVGPLLRTVGFCIVRRCMNRSFFVLLQTKRSLEHTETSPVYVNKSNVWAISTEYLWSYNRKTSVFGQKFIPVSLSSTHGRACSATRRFAASNLQSRGASCFCSMWETKLLSAVGGSVSSLV